MDIATACKNGNLEWLKQQLEAGELGDVTKHNNQAVRIAAFNGKLDVIKWLVNSSGQEVDVTEMGNYAVGWASASGYLKVVKWLVEESGQLVDCRELVTDFDNPNDCQQYLRQVAEIQHLVGLKDWLCVYQAQQRLSVARNSSRI